MFCVVEDFMPMDWAGDLGQWLFSQRHEMTRSGDDDGVFEYRYALSDLDHRNPEALKVFRKAIVDQLPKCLSKIEVPDFDLLHVESHGDCYHHGHHLGWHDGLGDDIVATRRVAFAYYMHSQPKMFSHGELEFVDGTTISPKNNQLVLWHPAQQHRVTRVECWSSHIMHARWSITGWLHGQPPKGWLDKLELLRS